MLKKIDVKNFRRHTDSTFTFDDGMSVMRGANEAGKSTILEAVAYALFGVKALRSPLAEAVTWGEPENSLKVVLEISVDNTTYVVSRGKSGAEVNYDGGRVTGQTEVTTFIAEKLRVDANSAAKLMLSTQMDIRGALEAGPKATTELIERLAEFGQIDHLIDVMQEKLTLGNTATAVAAVEAAQSRLDTLVDTVEPDLPALQRAISNAQASVTLAQEEFTKAKVADREAQAANMAAQAADREIKQKQQKLAAIERALEQARLDKESHRLNEQPEVPDADDRIQSAMQGKSALVEAASVRRAFNEVKPMLGKQSVKYYAGDMTTLLEAIDSSRALGTSEEREALGCDSKIAKLQGQLLLNSCSFCGKDFSDVPEVQAKNAEVQKAIDELNVKRKASMALARSSLDQSVALSEFLKTARIVDSTLSKYAQYLDVDRSTVPSILTWKESVVVHPAGEAEPDYDAEIARIKASVRARAEWVRVSQAAEDEYLRQCQARSELLASGTPAMPDLDAAAKAEAAARAHADDAQQTLDDMRRTLTTAENTLKSETQRWAREAQGRQDAEKALEVAKANLKALEFNNALLKKVRAARPLIADKLWNLVLSAVSKYFSEMRGTRSKVTKTSDGFLVDGRPVGVLSGSTLDILGLAVRVALVRTFLPQAPFLVLDEPCASMDEARTQALLGFLVAVGFKQTLVVTHEDVSESVADHILSIGS